MTTSQTDWMDVFTVIEGKDYKPDFWLKIGRMFPHKNGDGGYNIILNALPVNAKLVVKPRKPRSDDFDDIPY